VGNNPIAVNKYYYIVIIILRPPSETSKKTCFSTVNTDQSLTRRGTFLFYHSQ